MLSRYFCEVVCNVLTTQCEFQGTDTVLAVYCSAQPVLLCMCVDKIHDMIDRKDSPMTGLAVPDITL